jgi:hypothetical protein
MKSLLFILLSSLLSVSSFAQQAGMPPKPGSAAAAVLPAGAPIAAQVPTLPEPEGLDTASAAGSVTTISGGAIPAGGGLAANSTRDTATPTEAPDAEAPAVEAPAAVPPGLPDAKTADSGKKVDFLQRSNLILAKLLESERAVDPFGLTMDPANAKAVPVLADQYEEVAETTVVNNSMLKNALLTLPLTGVYPQKEVIVIGARSFNVGGQFGMKLQDLTIRLRFEGIRDGEIFFKDMETREVTSVPFNPLPAEFEPMVKGAKQPRGSGIVPMNDLFIAN